MIVNLSALAGAGQNYKFVLKTSAEVTILTWGNIYAGNY